MTPAASFATLLTRYFTQRLSFFLLPGAFDLAAAGWAQPSSAWASAAAATALALGLFAERWLLFREVRHASAAYYAPE